MQTDGVFRRHIDKARLGDLDDDPLPRSEGLGGEHVATAVLLLGELYVTEGQGGQEAGRDEERQGVEENSG